MRILLKLSYNGIAYHGWQTQQNAHSVQDELNSALSKLLGGEIETLGCGRTDTGVHAKEYFVQFDTEETIGKNFIYSLNKILPQDIAIHEAYHVPDDFSARFDAYSRSYEYHIHRSKDVFSKDFSYDFRVQLDIDLMNKACNELMKHHDFGSFSKSRTQVKSMICDITSAQWKEQGNALIFYITANRFLRGMVRAIVGTLLKVGSHEINLAEFKNIIEGKDRKKAGRSVPAHALFLTKVKYKIPLKPIHG